MDLDVLPAGDAATPLGSDSDNAEVFLTGGVVGLPIVREQIQGCLVPTADGLTVARPHPPENEAGEQGAPQEVAADAGQPCDDPVPGTRGRTHTVHQLLWPGAQVQRGGLLPGEHKVRAAATIAELADADDGQLQMQLNLDPGPLEDYLAAAEDCEDDGLPTSAHADVGEHSLQFVDSDDDEGPPQADNLEGHLLGVLEAQGAEPYYECGDQAGDGQASAEDDPTTDHMPQAPMDAQTLQRMLDLLRARGGQFENGVFVSACSRIIGIPHTPSMYQYRYVRAADPLAEDAYENEAGPHAEGAPEVQEEEGVSVADTLCEPLWKLEEPAESRLKNLQVRALASGKLS